MSEGRRRAAARRAPRRARGARGARRHRDPAGAGRRSCAGLSRRAEPATAPRAAVVHWASGRAAADGGRRLKGAAMSFEWPMVLWLLLAVPGLVAAYLWLDAGARRSRCATRASRVVREALGRAPAWRRHVPPVLLLVAITALVVAAARPGARITLPTDHRTIVLAIDVSLSMRANDIEPTRIAAAQAAAKTLRAGAADRRARRARLVRAARRRSCSRRRATARSWSRRSTASSCSATRRSAAAS